MFFHAIHRLNCTFLLLLTVILLPCFANAERASQTIYKLTEYSGRVTYANSPMKGAVKVVLEPLSVITLSTPRPLTGPTPDAVAVTAATAASKAGAANTVETISAGAMLAKRRDTIHKRVIQEEIQQEEQLLATAKQTLDIESRNTDTYRAIRSSLVANGAGTPPIDPATRSAVEKHFERKRLLLDEIDLHERTLVLLKLELKQSTQITVSSAN